jgi:hypothetical protein
MNLSRRPGHRRESARKPARLRTRLALLLGGAAAAAMLLLSTGGSAVSAQSSQGAEARQKRYKATRAFVADKQTGRARMPTEQEIQHVVSDLSTLAKRTTDNLPQSTSASGTVTVSLEGGFGGVVLARPNEDGTWETRCVFTLEEGVEFLGLVVDDASR